jgi:hypothetical protein
MATSVEVLHPPGDWAHTPKNLNTPQNIRTGLRIPPEDEKNYCVGAIILRNKGLPLSHILVQHPKPLVPECRFCGCRFSGAVAMCDDRWAASAHTPHDDGINKHNFARYKCRLCPKDTVFEFADFEEHVKDHLRDGTPLCLARVEEEVVNDQEEKVIVTKPLVREKKDCPNAEHCPLAHA